MNKRPEDCFDGLRGVCDIRITAKGQKEPSAVERVLFIFGKQLWRRQPIFQNRRRCHRMI